MKRYGAFTLIELMITLVLVVVLAGISYPSFISSLQKARRAEAKATLMAFSNAMERYYTQNYTYLGAGLSGDKGVARIFSATSPLGGGIAYYNLSISAATAMSYTLTAIPIGLQANDKCGDLTLTDLGVKGIVSSANGVGLNDCW